MARKKVSLRFGLLTLKCCVYNPFRTLNFGTGLIVFDWLIGAHDGLLRNLPHLILNLQTKPLKISNNAQKLLIRITDEDAIVYIDNEDGVAAVEDTVVKENG